MRGAATQWPEGEKRLPSRSADTALRVGSLVEGIWRTEKVGSSDLRGHLRQLGSPLVLVPIMFVTIVLLAQTAPLVLLLSALLLAPALIYSPSVRIAFLSVGALGTLQSSQDFDYVKVAYLVGAGIATLGAGHSLVRTGGVRRHALPLVISMLVMALVVVSFPVALLHGAAVVSWIRDAAPYVLVGLVPLLAIDSMQVRDQRLVPGLLIMCGALAALAFALEWLHRRNLSQLGDVNWILPSFGLGVALFSYAVASVIGMNAVLRWMPVAAFVMACYVVTGTRTMVVVMGAPVAAVLSGSMQTMRMRLARVITGAPLFVLLTFLFSLSLAAVSGSDLRAAVARLGTISEAIPPMESAVPAATLTSAGPLPNATLTSPAPLSIAPTARPTIRKTAVPTPTYPSPAAQSFTERITQSRIALEAFASSPLFGVGLGHEFVWSSVTGRQKRGLSPDTPLAFLAKFGLVGLLVLALCGVIAGRLWIRTMAMDGWTTERAAVVAFAAVWILHLPLGLPFEDKGFALGTLLLVSLCSRRPHEP